mgnify:CR=1 FL=1
MRKLLTLTFMTIAFVLNAKVYNPNTLPVDMDSITYSRVINPDSILKQETVSAIDTLLLQLQRETGVQAMIIAITNIENDDPFQFTLDVFNKYGVGNKQNTGFVLTLATDDRSYQLVTGEGLEGTLPDYICKRIENRVMVPHLKESNWDMAMLETVMTIKEYIEGDETIRQAYETDDGDDPLSLFSILCIMFGPIIGIGAFAKYQNYKKKFCKECKAHKMKMVNSQINRLSATQNEIKELWHCENCGHDEYRSFIRMISTGGGGGGSHGGSYHSSGGSHRSSGSFGGFGGGHSMGGGAGGRF